MNAPIIVDEMVLKESDNDDNRKDDDLHLRSTNTVINYHMYATDGEIGYVNDFIIDDKSSKVLYFVIYTNNWIDGKRVLLDVKNIKDIKWDYSKILLDISIEAVKDCRLFDKS